MPHTHTHAAHTEPVVVNDRDEGSSAGLIVGIIMAIIVGLILLFYGIPFLANSARQNSPSVSVPDKVDVNMNK